MMVPSEVGKYARCEWYLITWFRVKSRSRTKICQGGRSVGCYIGFAESMGHAHKTLNLENSDLTENGYTRNIGDVRK